MKTLDPLPVHKSIITLKSGKEQVQSERKKYRPFPFHYWNLACKRKKCTKICYRKTTSAKEKGGKKHNGCIAKACD
jgi:hypothetical protein